MATIGESVRSSIRITGDCAMPTSCSRQSFSSSYSSLGMVREPGSHLRYMFCAWLVSYVFRIFSLDRWRLQSQDKVR